MRVRWDAHTWTGPPGAHSSPLFIVAAAGEGGAVGVRNDARLVSTGWHRVA